MNKLQAAARGAEDSWQCEYAANSLKPGGQVLICSEDNVDNLSLQAYAEKLGDQLEIGLLDLMNQDVSEVRLGRKIFTKVNVSTGSFDFNVYIRQVDDTFVYIYHVVISHELTEGEEKAALDSITAIT